MASPAGTRSNPLNHPVASSALQGGVLSGLGVKLAVGSVPRRGSISSWIETVMMMEPGVENFYLFICISSVLLVNLFLLLFHRMQQAIAWEHIVVAAAAPAIPPAVHDGS